MLVFSFLIGIILGLQLPELPSPLWLIILPFFIILSLKYKKVRFLNFLLIGFFWVVVHGHYILWSSLPDDAQGKNLLISGVIDSLPDLKPQRSRFSFTVEKMSDDGKTFDHFPKKIRLSWYDKKRPKISAGEKWQFVVRLKTPHGMMNPGGFDYEKWLFERRIRATGYIRKSDDNVRLAEASVFSVNAYRENLKQRIINMMPNSRYLGIVLALTIGDKSEITSKQWEVFTATGTNHLVAISGLHIGLVAGAIFLLTGFLLKSVPKIFNRFAAHKVSAISAIMAAFIYAMLAGFAIPTQRALIMILVVMLFLIFNRRLHPRNILLTALVVVTVIDPFSMLSAGFWLSYIAVAAILFAMQNRYSMKSIWWKWGRLQWIVSVALVPALLYFFQVFSIISPVANVIAVPWISLLVVPFVLIGSLLSFSTPISELCFWFVDFALHGLWIVLDYLSQLSFAKWEQFSPAWWTLFPSIIAVFLLLAPRGIPARHLAIFLFLPLFIVKTTTPDKSQFTFTLLDVGQGLAAAVQTKNHFLIFDTGPSYSSTFNTGEAVILPFMRSLGINNIDKLFISHGDRDHIGGLKSILEKTSVDEVVTSVPTKVSHRNVKKCQAEDRWTWDGVLFEILNPNSTTQHTNSKRSGNNRSCVLRVSAGDNAVLLTADIEKKTEFELVSTHQNRLTSNILVVPHHGSNTSSTNQFILAVDPEYALYPAGYRNRFGHPTERVKNRYQNLNIKGLNTAETGAISFLISEKNISSPLLFRDKIRRFWNYERVEALIE